MEKDLKINISVSSDLKGANETKKALNDISKETKNTTTSLGKMRDVIGSGFSKFGGALSIVSTAITAFNATATAMGSNAVKLNSDYENLNNRLTSLVFTADKSSNIDPLAKWQNSKDKVRGLIDELKALDKELAFSQNDLADMFASFYSTAQNSLSFDKALEVFKKISYAAEVSGADVNSLKMTLDSLGAGMVNTATDFGRFVSGVGLDTQKLKQAIEDGNFAEVLIDGLGRFEESAKLAEVRFDTLKNSALNSFNEIQRNASKPLFESLKTSLENLNKYLDDGSSNLSKSLEDLYSTFADLAKSALKPENIEAAAGAFTSLLSVVNSLASGLKALSDIVVPDWLFGEDAGIGTALSKSAKGWDMALNNFKANIQNLKLSDGLFDENANKRFLENLVNESNKAFDEIKNSLLNLGGEFSGFNDLIFDATKINSGDIVDEISKIDEKIKELKLKTKEIDKGSWFDSDGAYESKRAIDTLVKALETYKTQLESIKNTNQEVNESDLTANTQANNKKALDSFIKSNEARVKNHDKTIESLKKKETDLTKALIDGEKQRQNIIDSYSQKRLDVAFDADEKIRRANQTNMSDQQKFYDDQRALAENLSKAKQALLDNDLESYKRFSDLANQLNESLGTKQTFKSGENETTLNRVEAYKNAVLELADMQSEALSKQEAAELEAHDKKMASINAELEATRTKIDLEMSFYTELIALQEKLSGGKIEFDTESFETTKQKMAEIDALINSQKTVDINTTNANAQIEATKQNLLTLNGTTLEVNADTTPADFGIQKLVTTIKENGDVEIKVNPEFKEAKAKIDQVKDEAKKPAKLEIKADDNEAKGKIKELTKTTNSKHDISVDDSKAKSAIKNLQKNTSSTHTIYVREVKRKALGGLIDGYKNGGLLKFKRRRGKIAGHDLTGRDDVPAMLTRGEFIQNVRAVDYYGSDFFHALNERRIPKDILKFATGGLVINHNTPSGGSASSGGGNSNNSSNAKGKIRNLDELIALLQEKLKNPFLYPQTKAYFQDTLTQALTIKNRLANQDGTIKGRAKVAKTMSDEATLLAKFNSYLDRVETQKKYIDAEKSPEFDESIDLEALKDYAKTIKENKSKIEDEIERVENSSTSLSSYEMQQNLKAVRNLRRGQIPEIYTSKKKEEAKNNKVQKLKNALDLLKDFVLFLENKKSFFEKINSFFGASRSFTGIIGGFKQGGLINLTSGGKLKGYGGGDKNLALLENGEFVLKKESVKKYGLNKIKALNSLNLPKFNQGGYVGEISSASQSSKNVNLSFDFGKNQKATALSDDENAQLLLRYLKGSV